MSLNKSDIDQIAWLARLTISENDVSGYTRDLNNILNMVEQMSEIDTSGIKPLAHPLEISARLRDDCISETNQREKFQSIAPDVENGHYLVPKVIE